MNCIPKLGLQSIATIFAMLLLSGCSTNNSYTFPKSETEGSSTGSSTSTSVHVITEELITSQKNERENEVEQELKQLLTTPIPYRIGSGDILSIVIWGHPELVGASNTATASILGDTHTKSGSDEAPAGFVIDHDGQIQYPFVGSIKMGGLTESEARDLLVSKINFYINRPNVTLRIQGYRSQRIYIDGEVKNPGLQQIDDIPMSLMEALNRAGGLLPTADQSQVTVTRGSAVYQINLSRIARRGIDPAHLMLISGDLIRVLSRDESKVFVTGEVVSPKSLSMHNGRLTLNEALGESGGINPLSGDARKVYVVRKSEKQSIVYQLDAKSTDALAIAESFELKPRDLVYVAPTGLTDWHRTISLLFPEALSTAVGAGRQP